MAFNTAAYLSVEFTRHLFCSLKSLKVGVPDAEKICKGKFRDSTFRKWAQKTGQRKSETFSVEHLVTYGIQRTKTKNKSGYIYMGISAKKCMYIFFLYLSVFPFSFLYAFCQEKMDFGFSVHSVIVKSCYISCLRKKNQFFLFSIYP